MPSAADDLRSLIERAGGAIRFDTFVEECLYGEHGFYTASRGHAGRRGDFITSPEIGPLFGHVLARALDGWWTDMGRPDNFSVVEFGAGPGTLARSILAAGPECLAGRPGAYVAVEISASQRNSHPSEVQSVAELSDEPIVGVVLANEFLDNVPFRLLVRDGEWREAWVGCRGDDFVEVLRPFDVPEFIAALGRDAMSAPLGARIPYQERAGRWVNDIRRRLDGRLVLIDYMVPMTSALAGRPWREWLRTFAGHQRGAHYLANVGEQDVTSDVCIDQLRDAAGEPDAVRTQAQFLQRWGIDDLVDEGKRIWTEGAARPDLVAMRMRSRIAESEALLDVTGLGHFTVLEYSGAHG